MTRRAEQVDLTRQQIAAAAARLHTSIGPANTSIAAIAEEAGVTRLTVYRHFPDFDVLFAACRAHWRAENPPPDAGAWPAVDGLEPRARRAFTELYGWFRGQGRGALPDLPRPDDDAGDLAGIRAGRYRAVWRPPSWPVM